MFGIAFGIFFGLIYWALLAIFERVASSPLTPGQVLVVPVFSVILGILAHCGLKRIIKNVVESAVKKSS